jgi:hypothetical protein
MTNSMKREMMKVISREIMHSFCHKVGKTFFLGEDVLANLAFREKYDDKVYGEGLKKYCLSQEKGAK